MSNFNLNKVILGGRLVADPDLRTLASGVPTVTITIANNGNSKNADVQYIDAVAWRNNAEVIAKYFKKGSNICVVGSLKSRSWTDRNGDKRYKTEVEVSEVIFVDSRADMPTGDKTDDVSEPSVKKENLEGDSMSEELPF